MTVVLLVVVCSSGTAWDVSVELFNIALCMGMEGCDGKTRKWNTGNMRNVLLGRSRRCLTLVTP